MKKCKIIGVRVERCVDDNPDSSYLGEYSDSTGHGWYVDREDGQLYDSDGNVLADSVCNTRDRNEYRYIGGFQHDGQLKSWKHVDDKQVNSAFLRCRYQGNGWEVNRHTHNLFSYFGVIGWETAQTRAEKVRLLDVVYCCLNVHRLERLNAGDWCYIGTIAKAEIVTPSGTRQTIRSGGLWGVESDSGKNYLALIAEEQLSELRGELEALGIGARSIDFAFKNVEEVEE